MKKKRVQNRWMANDKTEKNWGGLWVFRGACVCVCVRGGGMSGCVCLCVENGGGGGRGEEESTVSDQIYLAEVTWMYFCVAKISQKTISASK